MRSLSILINFCFLLFAVDADWQDYAMGSGKRGLNCCPPQPLCKLTLPIYEPFFFSM